jgi:hypothetical protein
MTRRRIAAALAGLALLLSAYVFVVAPTEVRRMRCQDALQLRQQTIAQESRGQRIANFTYYDAETEVSYYCH